MTRLALLTVILLAMPTCTSALSLSYYGRYCSETDGGLDYYQQGTTTDSAGTYTDECLNVTSLKEWRCDQGTARSTVYRCTDFCSEGRCGGFSLNADHGVYQCTDSDGGMNYTLKGTVNGHEEDKCVSSSRLREWYCKNNMPRSTIYHCENGCDNGVCVQKQAATVLKTTATIIYWTAASTANVTAASNQTGEGAAITGCISTNADGINYYVKGVTQAGQGKWTDSCVGGKRIQKYYCSRGKMRSAMSICPRGCVDGACKPAYVI
jgi:hypothetical protein